MQEFVYQVVRRTERHLQLIKGGLARRQGLCIAYEFEARVDGVTNDVGEIIEIERGNVFGAILQPQRTECPVERIARAFPAVDVVLARCETRAFGQVAP